MSIQKFSYHYNSRIINGQVAYPGQFPWQVLIYFTKGTSRITCGGSLISDRWVLTAAHCTNGVGVTKFQLHLGSVNQGQVKEYGRVITGATNVIVHEEYNITGTGVDNDVALIKLKKKIDFTDRIESIDLADENDYLDKDIWVIVSGWGKTTDFISSTSHVLKYVRLQTISNTECEILYGSDIITNTVLCCMGSGNTCQGDSGGPLIIKSNGKYIHAGIISFVSSRGCNKPFPSGYMRTASYRKWIDRHINSGSKVLQRPYILFSQTVFILLLKQITF